MNRQTNTFYNTFSIFYPLVDIFLKAQKKRLFKEINKLPYGKVLEIGIGNGSHINQYKTHQITGIDTSYKMLETARKNKDKNIQLLEMNGENLSFANHTFDYIVLSHIIAVTENPEILLEEAYRVLKPNGKLFILNHFTPDNWLKYIDKLFHFISNLFHFKSLFKIEDISAIKNFVLSEEIKFSKLSYFKLLIFIKP